MKLHKKIALLCLPWFLAACSTIPTTSDKPRSAAKPQPASKVQPQPASVDAAAKAPAAVVALLDRAEQQLINGDDSAAAVSLERAIRIAPRYPESYYRLGKLRFTQSYHDQARALAQKAISLGASGWLRRQAERLVALIDERE
ncbi:hypothetical protein [Thalassotalea sp. ND16A]|uniref:hypothetical protein n=1 Tax=Thalassotalea sp. ND16A TaxID=1535422 RepID=UPI00051A5F02|nr:hypothetical protein [Thalassotalea sp. ND16A]KGK00384.1 hypothetical protein ND16A_3591 [Thalassotalea sp. ND16A]